jgi:Mlc titration factor MtfA (ptsG expression regulator)
MISTTEIYKVLLFEFPYFKKINEERRELLCRRTQEFIAGTKFIPRKEMILTDRMIILISACAQQLTLGFKKHYKYIYFEKIIVYPEKYLSTHTGRYHTGEMNTAGAIVLSWEDFYKGITIDNDTHNVGLHEFAHALEFMDMAHKDIDETFSTFLDKFFVHADYYLKNKPEESLFRSYATKNTSEFFAVATEYYFEAPAAFRQREPELFAILDTAYQQRTSNAIYKTTSRHIVKSPVRILGNSKPFLNYLGELSLYASIIGIIVAAVLKGSMIGAALFGIISFYLAFNYLFKDRFTLYENDVQIHQPLIKQIVKMLFPSKYNYNMSIGYSDVLYVTAREFNIHTQGSLTIFVEHLKKGCIYTLCYYQNGKIRYARKITNDLDYDKVFRFLYTDKMVATRLEGKIKKY